MILYLGLAFFRLIVRREIRLSLPENNLRGCNNVDFGIKTPKTCFYSVAKKHDNRIKTCPTSVVSFAVFDRVKQLQRFIRPIIVHSNCVCL